LKTLLARGYPDENIYEFAAKEILEYGKKWKEIHKGTSI
jgi:hypothetical protein